MEKELIKLLAKIVYEWQRTVLELISQDDWTENLNGILQEHMETMTPMIEALPEELDEYLLEE